MLALAAGNRAAGQVYQCNSQKTGYKTYSTNHFVTYYSVSKIFLLIELQLNSHAKKSWQFGQRQPLPLIPSRSLYLAHVSPLLNISVWLGYSVWSYGAPSEIQSTLAFRHWLSLVHLVLSGLTRPVQNSLFSKRPG